MNIQATKIELVQLMLRVEEEQVLKQIKDILMSSNNIIEQYNQELDEAEARLDAGQHVEHRQVVEEINEWLKKEK